MFILRRFNGITADWVKHKQQNLVGMYDIKSKFMIVRTNIVARLVFQFICKHHVGRRQEIWKRFNLF